MIRNGVFIYVCDFVVSATRVHCVYVTCCIPARAIGFGVCEGAEVCG